MYDKLILYYFTGTGNALAAAMWISEIAKAKNITSDVIKISPSKIVKKEELSGNTMIGFCYPTHGFNAPPVVIDFILRLPKQNNMVFILNTRAGMKLSKFFLPGLSGMAQLLPALILKFKGFKVIGFQPMDLPSNWISIHPGLRQKVITSIFDRCERITKNFATKIFYGKKVYRGFLSFPIDILISPISFAYYFFGRFALSKTFIAGINCNCCKLCVKECPVNAIKMAEKFPFWTKRCESCMNCMNRCPKQAIQTPHLFVVLLWWLVFSGIPMFLMNQFTSSGSYIHQNYRLFVWIYLLVCGIPIIFFSYKILHYIMRFRFFRWLITYTSLTKLHFWRRYFAPKRFVSQVKSEK